MLQAQQEEAYVDMAQCAEEREKGNTAFKEARYPEAVGHYQEALKRCGSLGGQRLWLRRCGWLYDAPGAG